MIETTRRLPANLDSEKYVLGTMLQDDKTCTLLAANMEPYEFSLHAHQTIFMGILSLLERGEHVDRLTVVNELMLKGLLQSVGGMTYLVSLEEGIPINANVDSYVRNIKDMAGRRRLIQAAQRIEEQAYSGHFTSDEIASGSLKEIESVQSVRNELDGRMASQIVEEYPGGVNAFLDPSRRKKGIPSGFAKFDEMTGGFHDGELIILAARPSMGKTAIAMNMAEHQCLSPKQRRFATVFSLEMTGDALLTRMLCARAHMDQQKFRAGYVNKEERFAIQSALSEIMDARLKIFDRAETTVEDVCRNIKRMVNDEGLHIAYIDYLQLLGSKRKAENQNLKIGAITRELKITAKDCGIPIVVLSQLSRANEKRPGVAHRPMMSDLLDSGRIEADADVIMFIHREEVYNRQRDDLKGLAELILAKQRNGPIGTIDLRFMGQWTRFEDRADTLFNQPAGEGQ